ncbi:MAG: hypothetical protein VKJ06_00725 [Vampirovibrionales bacterium]|nr:hypothetical protein [Vampirovibrionales bacterium]
MVENPCPPVLFIFFRRPEVTLRVFERIAQAKPTRLYLASDGPRANQLNEADTVSLLREAILSKIDWPCDVQTNFSDTNLGCAHRMSSAIDWFFENEPEGIILEDDCLPDPSFFEYCAVMLERYRDDTRMMHVAGYHCFEPGKSYGEGDYFFIRTPLVWGWASWRRAWHGYDLAMVSLESFLKTDGLYRFYEPLSSLSQTGTNYHLHKIRKEFLANRSKSWDYPWAFHVMRNHGLCVVPRVNLVSNIGVGSTGTHKRLSWNNPDANRPTESLTRFKAPEHHLPNWHAERYLFKRHLRYSLRGLGERAVSKLILRLMR